MNLNLNSRPRLAFVLPTHVGDRDSVAPWGWTPCLLKGYRKKGLLHASGMVKSLGNFKTWFAFSRSPDKCL